jgi:Ca2+-transporting ATPase
VFLQLWNQFNARHIGPKDFNPFRNFCTNFTFLGILIFASAVQMIMVEFGGDAVKVYPLTKEQQIISILFGMLSLVTGVIIKCIPLEPFEKIKVNDDPVPEAELEKKITNTLKKSSTMR